GAPGGPGEPMYMPGRLRTGSRPSRTCMSLAPYEVLPCGKARPFGEVDFLGRTTGARRPFAWSEPQITTTQVYQRGVTFPLIPGVFASPLRGIHRPGAQVPSPRPGDPSRRAWSPATAVDPDFD